MLRLYTLGDSNSSGDLAWPRRLQQTLYAEGGGDVMLVNESLPGRSIGVQKFGPDSNALLIIEDSLRAAWERLGGVDEIVIFLGTNDTQPMWAERGHTVADIAASFELLLNKIEAVAAERGGRPRITVLTPPALGSVHDDGAAPGAGKLAEEQAKRRGSARRLSELAPLMRAIARRHGARFVDVLARMRPERDRWVGEDGTHLTPEAQEMVAAAAAEAIRG